MITLRAYQPDDASSLLELFKDTIRRVNSQHYSPEQIRAWASDNIDLAVWAARFNGRFVVVVEEAARPVGFAELELNGHIGRVYVSADHQRCGVGQAMMNEVLLEVGDSDSSGCLSRRESPPCHSSRRRVSQSLHRRS